MPLFGVSIGLSALRDRVAENLGCDRSAAEAILAQKLRRGEIVACCEWAYVAGREGEVVTAHRLSPEPWVMAEKVNWSDDTLSVRAVAKEVSYASGIYFWTADIDFLDEKHSADEVARETPKRGRRPGTGLEKADAPFVEQVVAMVRAGKAPSAQAAARIVVGDGKGIPGDGTVDSKIDRLRRQANFLADGGE